MSSPKPPSGNSPQAAWLRNLVRYVLGLELHPGRGYRINRLANGGYTLSIDQASSSTPSNTYPFQLYKSGTTASTFSIRKGIINVPLFFPRVTTPRDITPRRAFIPAYIQNPDGTDLSFTVPPPYTSVDVWLEIAQEANILDDPAPWDPAEPGFFVASDNGDTAAVTPRWHFSTENEWPQFTIENQQLGQVIVYFPICRINLTVQGASLGNPGTVTGFTFDQYPRSHVAGCMVSGASRYCGAWNNLRLYYPGDTVGTPAGRLYQLAFSTGGLAYLCNIGTDPDTDTAAGTTPGTRWMTIG